MQAYFCVVILKFKISILKFTFKKNVIEIKIYAPGPALKRPDYLLV